MNQMIYHANQDLKNIHVNLQVLQRRSSVSKETVLDADKSDTTVSQITDVVRTCTPPVSSCLVLFDKGSESVDELENTSSSHFEPRGSLTHRPQKLKTPRLEKPAPLSARGRVESKGQFDLWFGPMVKTKGAETGRRSSVTRLAKGNLRQPTYIVLKTEGFPSTAPANSHKAASHLRPSVSPRIHPPASFGSRSSQHLAITARTSSSWSGLFAASLTPTVVPPPPPSTAAAINPAPLSGALTTRPLRSSKLARGSRLVPPPPPAAAAAAAHAERDAELLQDRLVADSASFLRSQAIRRVVGLADAGCPARDTLYARFLLESAARPGSEGLCLVPILLELRVLSRGGGALNRRLSSFDYDAGAPITDGLLTRRDALPHTPGRSTRSPPPRLTHPPPHTHTPSCPPFANPTAERTLRSEGDWGAWRAPRRGTAA